MDFELMINSLPKLLNATAITLKLLSASIVFWIIHWSFICSAKNE